MGGFGPGVDVNVQYQEFKMRLIAMLIGERKSM